MKILAMDDPAFPGVKILHVITTFSLGGATENTLFSVEGLQALGYDVSILAGPPNIAEGDLFARARERNVRVSILPQLGRNIHPWKDFVALIKLIQILRKERVTLVHTHSSKAGILGRIAAFVARTPIVVHTIHGLPFHDYQRWFPFMMFRLAEKWCAMISDKLITVTDTITEKVLAERIGKPEQFATVRSGFETKEFTPRRRRRNSLRKEFGLRSSDLVVGKIARFSPLKGHRYLIEAIPLIVAEVPTARFLLVGGGELEGELKDHVRKRGIAPAVVFGGLVPMQKMPEVISIMDVIVHTSLLEGLARVLPQSLASEKPVVSFDIDGAHEVITHGRTGFLVPPGDTGLLAASIIDLLKNPRKAHRFGRAGRKVVEKQWTVDVMVREIDKIYRTLLKKRLGSR